MYSEVCFDKFKLNVSEFTCNKFGFAELFVKNYLDLNLDLESKSILDVGSGVGPLSIFLAEKGGYVDAIDINPIATELCKKNVNANKLNSHVNCICGDFSKFNFCDRYDLIITNPPIDIMNGNKMDNDIMDKIKDKKIDSGIFSFITNSWKDENNNDLSTYIFKKSRSILKDNGKIILIFGDIDNNNYQYINKISKEYNLKIVKHISENMDSKKIGLPKEYKSILAHIVVLGFDTGWK